MLCSEAQLTPPPTGQREVVRGRVCMGTLPFTSSFSPRGHTTVQDPRLGGRAIRMAEFLPLLPCTPLLTQDVCAQDSWVPPAEEPSQEAQGGRVQGPAPKRWKLLEVPTIQITPASNEESPPCTPPPQCLQLPRTPDPESSPQDRSDLGGGMGEGFSLSGLKLKGGFPVADTVLVGG